ncbi:molecular chaperone Tir, partial [Salmonella enterica subsp. enterica serovar Stanley]|nr:molecular chaperone Tir [Salmonella enterica subsp. enterica serovar Stanley]
PWVAKHGVKVVQWNQLAAELK